MNEISKNAEKILQSEEEIKEFAELNRLTIEAARQLLDKFLKDPEISEEVNDFIFSKDRGEDFKGYIAGEEKGYQRGHESGFAKGALVGVVGVLAGLTIAGWMYLKDHK